MLIRAEEPKGWPAVHAVNQSALGSSAEARLVEALREDASILGHILIALVALPAHPELKIMGLAPMRWRRRISARASAPRWCAPVWNNAGLGFGAVVVLWHPDYHARSGVFPAARLGIGCECEVSAEAFMLVELQRGFLREVSGEIKYHEAFSNPWAKGRQAMAKRKLKPIPLRPVS